MVLDILFNNIYIIEGRVERNKLREIIFAAEEERVITKEEVGFIVTLVERFRADIEKKFKQIHIIQGEINQLKVNEQTIVSIVQNLISSAERDKARRETMTKLKEGRKIELERERHRKAKAPSEQDDVVEKKK